MKKHLVEISKRLVTGMLVTGAVIGVCLLTIHSTTQNQNFMAPSLKSVQTDKATAFYANSAPRAGWCAEQALPGTSDSSAATADSKSIAAALSACWSRRHKRP